MGPFGWALAGGESVESNHGGTDPGDATSKRLEGRAVGLFPDLIRPGRRHD